MHELEALMHSFMGAEGQRLDNLMGTSWQAGLKEFVQWAIDEMDPPKKMACDGDHLYKKYEPKNWAMPDMDYYHKAVNMDKKRSKLHHYVNTISQVSEDAEKELDSEEYNWLATRYAEFLADQNKEKQQ